MTEIIKVALYISGAGALVVTLPGSVELLLLTLGAMRRPPRVMTFETRPLRLAAVIPAHNEEKLISNTIGALAASARMGGNCEIVVVADNCEDDTAVVAAEAGARVIVRRNSDLRGKGYALRLAFDQLQTEGFDAFLVVDADSIVSNNLVGEVRQALGAGAAAAQCRYRVSDPNASARTRLMDLAFLAFNVVRPRGRSGWGLSAGILGNGFALRSETLQKVPWDASSIVEDLEYHLRLVAASMRVDYIDRATVYGEMPARSSDARVQRSRWEGGRLRMAREWAPRLAAAVMHGQWRLAEPLMELLLAPLAYHVLLLAFAFAALPGRVSYVALAGLILAALHVIEASLMGGRPLKTAATLATAPFYVLWKLTTLFGVFSASRRDAGWVRTGRNSQARNSQA